MPDQGTREQVAWNIASMHATHIAKLLEKGTLKSINGNYKGAFDHFAAIRNLINCELKAEERETMDIIERQTFISVNRWHKIVNDPNLDGDFQLAGTSNKCIALVRSYQRKIMDFLKELGYLPSKEDRTKMTF